MVKSAAMVAAFCVLAPIASRPPLQDGWTIYRSVVKGASKIYSLWIPGRGIYLVPLDGRNRPRLNLTGTTRRSPHALGVRGSPRVIRA